MEFLFETTYDRKALAAMAKALRKTIRKKHNRKSCIFGSIVSVLGLLLVLKQAAEGELFSFRTIVTLLAVIIMIATLIWQDQVNGYFAGKRLLPGSERARSVFTEDGFRSETEIGNTEWHYDKILGLAETNEYFAFLFSANHAQVYDRKTLEGGSEEEFRAFIEAKTNKKILKI